MTKDWFFGEEVSKKIPEYQGAVRTGAMRKAGLWDQEDAMADAAQRQLGQFKEAQGDVDLIRRAAMGAAPSQAQSVLQEGRDAALQNAMALAKSGGPGMSPAAAQFAAQQQAANIGQQAANQASRLRAQEMAQARGDLLQGAGMLGSMASQQRGQTSQDAFNTAKLRQAQAMFQDQQALQEWLTRAGMAGKRSGGWGPAVTAGLDFVTSLIPGGGGGK